jgi:uncharacterized membrane protein
MPLKFWGEAFHISLIEFLVKLFMTLLLWSICLIKNQIIMLCVFLGVLASHIFAHNSNIHKGYKCLDVSTGRVYVSQCHL